MKLIDRLRRQPESERAIEQAVVMSESWQQSSREQIGRDFVSWSQDGFGGNPVVFGGPSRT